MQRDMNFEKTSYRDDAVLIGKAFGAYLNSIIHNS
jgi:hypothetical protein